MPTVSPIVEHSPKQLAARLGYSIHTIRKMMRQSPDSLPPSIRLGGWRIRFIGVEKWLEERARAGQ
jgi:predicted DNA-binding transcriptional regulator AlpA